MNEVIKKIDIVYTKELLDANDIPVKRRQRYTFLIKEKPDSIIKLGMLMTIVREHGRTAIVMVVGISKKTNSNEYPGEIPINKMVTINDYTVYSYYTKPAWIVIFTEPTEHGIGEYKHESLSSKENIGDNIAFDSEIKTVYRVEYARDNERETHKDYNENEHFKGYSFIEDNPVPQGPPIPPTPAGIPIGNITNTLRLEHNDDRSIIHSVQSFLEDIIKTASINDVKDNVMKEIDELVKKKYGSLPELHEIRCNENKIIIKGAVHEKFDEVLQLIQNRIPVYLTGEAGSGKNVICKQVAKAMNLDFYFTNAVTQEYKLTGFIDASGKFHETQFYKAFTEGGLFFLDEMDASIPEVLIILNAAIANGYFDFPVGKIEANKNFYVIAAGNTTGGGANEVYTGRYSLDKASLDRFALVDINYSPTIEKALCNDNEELLRFAHAFRKACDLAKLRCLFSYRSINRISILENVMPLKEVLNISLLKGMSEDDLKMLTNDISKTLGNNKYLNAMK